MIMSRDWIRWDILFCDIINWTQMLASYFTHTLIGIPRSFFSSSIYLTVVTNQLLAFSVVVVCVCVRARAYSDAYLQRSTDVVRLRCKAHTQTVRPRDWGEKSVFEETFWALNDKSNSMFIVLGIAMKRRRRKKSEIERDRECDERKVTKRKIIPFIWIFSICLGVHRYRKKVVDR